MKLKEAIEICKTMVKHNGCAEGAFDADELNALACLVYLAELDQAETPCKACQGSGGLDGMSMFEACRVCGGSGRNG